MARFARADLPTRLEVRSGELSGAAHGLRTLCVHKLIRLPAIVGSTFDLAYVSVSSVLVLFVFVCCLCASLFGLLVWSCVCVCAVLFVRLGLLFVK